MANVFKFFQNGDIVSSRSLLHEAIPITSSIWSGSSYTRLNIKDYSHGYFQSVFDYPHLSSSANQVCDITVGYSSKWPLSSSTNTQNAIKINNYNQIAQVLMGYDTTGSVLELDEDGDISAGGNKIQTIIVLNFSRLLYKDEIKKGSVSIKLGVTNPDTTPFTQILTITDAGAQNNFRVNSPVGEYGILSASIGGGYAGGPTNGLCGLVFYQAGIMVLTGGVFVSTTTDAAAGKITGSVQHLQISSSIQSITAMITGATISQIADGLRARIQDISFNNTTELNTTHYYCRFNNKEFNYSSNPTYLSGSKLVVKNNSQDVPVSYISEIGLYSQDNALLAVGKLSEVLKKDPTIETNIRLRTDF